MYRKFKKKEYYTEKAKREGYPARSIYKLKEIDAKYRIINEGDKVLDLGCSPGSWLLYVSEKVGNNGKVVGIDKDMIMLEQRKNIVFYQRNIFDMDESDFSAIGREYNSVISDLAPFTSGIKSVDAARSLELCEKAFEITLSMLKSGGNFVCKIFEGGESDEFIRRLSHRFQSLKRVRPAAVAKGSKELYVVCKGFKSEQSSNV